MPIDLGVTYTQNVLDAFTRIERKKEHRYVTFQIKDKRIILDQVGKKDATFQDFLGSIPRGSPRFIVYDVNFTLDDGRKCEKLLFIYWCPGDEGMPPREKMAYAAGKKAFMAMLHDRGCGSLSAELQIYDFEDFSEEEFIKAASKKK